MLDQLADFGVAIAVPIQVRTAAIEELKDLIGFGATGLEVETDGEILAEDFGEIGSGIDSSEFAVVDLISSVICMYRRKDFTKSLRVGIEWVTTQDLIWRNRDEALLIWTGGNANHVTSLC